MVFDLHRTGKCLYPHDTFICGTDSTYKHEACSGLACRQAAAAAVKRRSMSEEPPSRPKVWPFPHGTIQNVKAGCTCVVCAEAERMDSELREMEDGLFFEPDRISSSDLWPKQHGVNPNLDYDNMDELREVTTPSNYQHGYKKNCRCDLCRRAYSIGRMRERALKATVGSKSFQRYKARGQAALAAYDDIQAEHDAEVDAALQQRDSLTTYAALENLVGDERVATRNRDEAEKRRMAWWEFDAA